MANANKVAAAVFVVAVVALTVGLIVNRPQAASATAPVATVTKTTSNAALADHWQAEGQKERFRYTLDVLATRLRHFTTKKELGFPALAEAAAKEREEAKAWLPQSEIDRILPPELIAPK